LISLERSALATNAGQHGSDLVLKLKRLRRKRGIACAENAIVAKFDSELFLESFLDVDLGDDAEAFLLEGLRRAAYCLSKPTGSILLK
jgi:hypothetical protein